MLKIISNKSNCKINPAFILKTNFFRSKLTFNLRFKDMNFIYIVLIFCLKYVT